MADVSHGSVLEAFKTRYDYSSAQTVLKDVLKHSGVGEKDKYGDGDVKKFSDTLLALGEIQTGGIFETLAGPAPAAEPPAAKADDKADDKKADKADDKADDKKDDKADDKKPAAKKGSAKKK